MGIRGLPARRRLSIALTIAVFALAAAVVVIGYGYYLQQEEYVEQQVVDELSAISILKGEQVLRWRQDRLDEIMLLATSAPVLERLGAWLAEPTPEHEQFILGRLESFAARPEYRAAMVVGLDGSFLLGAGDYHAKLPESVLRTLDEAVAGNKPLLTELHRAVADATPHLDVIAPLTTGEGRTLGAVVLQIDPGEYLYTLVRSWPLPSESAETLIVARDGDDVLFLNDVRHVPDAALSLRIPLSETDVPAVRAVLGEEGLVYGTDYRGVPVLAVLSAIPDSSWRLVTKIDEAEAFAFWRTERRLLALLAFGIVLVTAGAVTVVWQRDHTVQLRSLVEAERARSEGESRYGATLMSVGDGVIATDADCVVALLNPVAEALTGWTQAEAVGHPLDEVFRIVNEHTREPVENPACRVLRSGAIVGLANHTILIAKDGTERPIADSGAPVRDEDGTVVGVVLVFRDQTQERAAHDALVQHQEQLQAAEKHAGLGSWEFHFESGRGWWSPQMCRMFGFDPAAGFPGADAYIEHVHPEDRPIAWKVIDDMRAGLVPAPSEYRTNPEYGPARKVSMTARLESDPDGRPVTFTGTALDITDRVRSEEELRRFMFMVENSPQEIYLVTRDGRMAYVNKAVAENLGYTIEELLDRPVSDIDPEFGPIFAEHFDELAESGPQTLEAVHLTRDGRKARKEIRSFLMRFGDEAYVCGFAQDVTERKAAESALRESEERYERLFENLTVGLAVHEVVTDDEGVVRDYRFLQVNPAFERLTGLKAAGLLGKTVLEVMPETESHWIERYGRVALSGEPLQFEEYSQVLDTYFDVFAYSPGAGRFATVFSDVSDRKRAELELKESRQMLRLVLDTIPVRVFWKNCDLAYLGCNQPFALDAGCASPDDVIGRNDFDLVWAEQAEQYRADDIAVIESGVARLGYEEPQTTPDGRLIWLRTSKVPLVSAAGTTIGVMGTYEDITALKMAREELEAMNRSLEGIVAERTESLRATNEELEATSRELRRINAELVEAGEAKSRFLRAMSHELRTPLNSIIGFAGVMLQGLAGRVSTEQRRQLEMIDNAGRHLLALINDILDLSRIEAGRIDIVMEPVDVVAVAQNIIDSVHAAASVKEIALHLEVRDEPLHLISDARKIRQILINLVGNAVKFTDEGDVTVSIHRPAEAMIAFSIIDTGPGVAEADRELIFGEFVQAAAVPDPEREGTGLGLAISKGLAAALGGMVTLESTSGEGSTFTLLLPESPVDI